MRASLLMASSDDSNPSLLVILLFSVLYFTSSDFLTRVCLIETLDSCWLDSTGWPGMQMVFLFTFLTGNFSRILALNWRFISQIDLFLLLSVKNQLSYRSSDAFSLVSALTLSISFITERHSSDRSVRSILKIPRDILRYNSASDCPLKGK
jgi:hypothetical protein